MPRYGPRTGIAVLAVTLFVTAAGCGEVDSASTTTDHDTSPTPAQSSVPPSTASATATTAESTTTATASPTSTTTAAPTTTTSPPFEPAETGPATGLIRFGGNGIVIAPFDGDETVIPGDRYYPIVRQAAPDGTGGLVYQLLEVHPSWPEGTIFRLAPGALSPEPVFVPSDDTRTELYGVVRYKGEPSLLLGHQTLGGFYSTTVLAAPLTRESPRLLLMTLPGMVDDVSYGGDVFVAATPTSDECTTPAFFNADGAVLEPPAAIGCRLIQVVNPQLSADGSLLVYQSRDYVAVSSLASEEQWRIEGYLVDYDGSSTLVAIGPNPAEAWLVEVGRDGFGERTPIEDPGWASLYGHPIEIAPGATLELGQPEVECSVEETEFAPVEIDLPGPVAARREAILAAATTCDFIELGSLAEPHDGFDFFTPCCSFRTDMEDDPVRYWLIGEDANMDEMTQLVRLLQMEPGRIDGGWVWPAAVVQDESEIDWEQLEKLFAGPHEILYEVSRERGYYNGYIVEIMDSGRWRMFQQVIDPPIAG